MTAVQHHWMLMASIGLVSRWSLSLSLSLSLSPSLPPSLSLPPHLSLLLVQCWAVPPWPLYETAHSHQAFGWTQPQLCNRRERERGVFVFSLAIQFRGLGVGWGGDEALWCARFS